MLANAPVLSSNQLNTVKFVDLYIKRAAFLLKWCCVGLNGIKWHCIGTNGNGSIPYKHLMIQSSLSIPASQQAPFLYPTPSLYLTPHIPPLKPLLKETQYKPTIAALNTHHTALYLSMPISTPQIRPKTEQLPIQTFDRILNPAFALLLRRITGNNHLFTISTRSNLHPYSEYSY
ncbi:hypothetical protein PGT21_033301 [Puccinia graminis f. sp. tritici]|uniref:Uncharacterized protein n=1 Tax=Puccinia graminis f. sp. tritici TaxID=56615 RepID=A0A5B0MA69_PUCGR|nr:hypothetical protein PGTUg99_001725 [Puccinia graminis f. sp. tritici]KAA1084633.1 hypothetical protein PGT21_033301 [Puccinia graminis f. sp. tritici]